MTDRLRNCTEKETLEKKLWQEIVLCTILRRDTSKLQSLNSGTGNGNGMIATTNEEDVGSLDIERHGPDSSVASRNAIDQHVDDEAAVSVGGWRSISSIPSDAWAHASRMIESGGMSIGSISFGNSIRSRAPDGTIRQSRIRAQNLPQNLPALAETTPHTSRSTSARPSETSRMEWVPNRRGSTMSRESATDHYAPHPDIDFIAEATLVIEDTASQERETRISSDGVRAQRLMTGRLVDARSTTTEEEFQRFAELARRRDDVHDQQPPTYSQLARGLMAIGQQELNNQQVEEDDAYLDDNTLSTGFPIRDVEIEEADIVEAEPLHNKFIVPRPAMALLAIVVVSIIALSLGLALSSNNTGTEMSIAGLASYKDDDVVAYAPEDICFSLLPIMSNHSLACPDPTTQLTRGGPVCQLVADALLYAHHHSEEHSTIDVSIINGGAARGDINSGNVTAEMIRKDILPFIGNRVVYLAVSPAEIYQTLNGALVDTGRIFTTDEQEMFFPEAKALDYRWAYESSYPYASGLQFDVNLNAPEGEKVTNVSMNIGSRNDPDWKPLDPHDDTTMIRVVTVDFLAGGGDGYFPGVSDDDHEIKEDLGLKDLFLSYAAEQNQLLGPTLDQMSTRNFIPLTDY